MQRETRHGRIEILLEQYLRQHNISKNQAARSANLTRTRFNAYCTNKVQRVDLDVLSRLCNALNCDITDLLRYIPSENQRLD